MECQLLVYDLMLSFTSRPVATSGASGGTEQRVVRNLRGNFDICNKYICPQFAYKKYKAKKYNIVWILFTKRVYTQ